MTKVYLGILRNPLPMAIYLVPTWVDTMGVGGEEDEPYEGDQVEAG